MARLQWTRRRRRNLVQIPSPTYIRTLLDPNPPQSLFLNNFDEGLCKYGFFIAGIGAGKSHLGSHYAIEMAARNPDVRGLIAANTYTQLWQSTLTALYKVAKVYGVPIRPERPESAAKKKVLYLWDRVEVLCRSAENYTEWDGFEVGWFWLDEAKTMNESVWRTANERHRDVRCNPLVGWLTTSPDGFNWLHEQVEANPEIVRIVNAHTSENQKHLPQNYVKDLEKVLSPEMARQQLGGEFINVYSGQSYPNFSRAENMKQLSFSDDEILVGIDFNVEPGMHAYACQVAGEDFYVIDEIYIRGGDTPQLAKELQRRYGTERVVLIPDAAGAQRHTTGTSDHAILKEHGFKISCPQKNPAIKNRVNSVNGKIFNILGERHFFIDTSCRLLKSDLEKCTWEILFKDSYRGALTHPGAAVGYAVHKCFPFISSAFAVKLPKVF